AACDRRDGDTEAEGNAMAAVDVDAHVDGRGRIVGRSAQRLAESRPCNQPAERRYGCDRDQGRDRARLVDEYGHPVTPQRPDLPGADGKRRTDRERLRTEQDHGAIRENQRKAERENELRVMALAFESGGICAAHARDEEEMDEIT